MCKADAIEICQMIMETLINGNLVDSDPQITSIANVISQIAVCLKEDFVQFLPLIVPALLKDSQRDIALTSKSSMLMRPMWREMKQTIKVESKL